MGVRAYLLDRRPTTLRVGGTIQTIGTVRPFFKLTEMDAPRSVERHAAAQITPSPPAVMITDLTEFPLVDAPHRPVAAHLVLGWDEGRGSVTDFEWDYLPQLGFAVRDQGSGAYTLYEKREGCLQIITDARAKELGLLDRYGQFVRHGQPHISACKSVRPYLTGYAEAECVFENGIDVKLLFTTPLNMLPPEDWFVGKRPMDIEHYGDRDTRLEL